MILQGDPIQNITLETLIWSVMVGSNAVFFSFWKEFNSNNLFFFLKQEIRKLVCRKPKDKNYFKNNFFKNIKLNQTKLLWNSCESDMLLYQWRVTSSYFTVPLKLKRIVNDFTPVFNIHKTCLLRARLWQNGKSVKMEKLYR